MSTWAVRELALRAWVKAASGLDDEHVIWNLHKGNRPAAGPFITLRLGDVAPLTFVDEFQQVDFDATRDGDPLANPPVIGTELEYRIRGSRECALSVQCHSGTAVDGDSSARAVLCRVQQGLSNPAIRAALHAANVFPFDVGVVRDVSALIGTYFEGRAALDVRFYTGETSTAYETYIETVTITDAVANPDRNFTVTIEE